MNKTLRILSVVTLIILSSCFDISEVDQPEEVTLGEPFQNYFLMKTFEADANPHNLIIGLLLPHDWVVDSVYYEGDVFGPDYCTFLHNDSLDANLGGVMDSNWADTMAYYFEPPNGMGWRVYQGVTAYASETADTAYTDVFIDLTAYGPTGTAPLAYIVTNAALDFTADWYDISYGHNITVTGEVGTDPSVMPTELSLEQNYPNPFNPATEINFGIPNTGLVNLVVHDLAGREVATLHNGILPSGQHMRSWNGQNSAGDKVSSGMYIYRLESPDGIQTRKMLLLK
mgnify:CR=1 FL=1